MRTTISIEDGLLAEAKTRAREHNLTLAAVINEALRSGLLGGKEVNGSGINRRLKTFKGDGLQPGVELYNSAELLELMERQ